MTANVEHLISYGYPSSPLAVKLGKGKQGCWIYELPDAAPVVFDTLTAAVAHAKKQKSKASFFSFEKTGTAPAILNREAGK